jgi:mannose-6-phosphate isomerase-like protein (cupin superfamily)
MTRAQLAERLRDVIGYDLPEQSIGRIERDDVWGGMAVDRGELGLDHRLRGLRRRGQRRTGGQPENRGPEDGRQPDIDRQIAYYTEVVGLTLVAREANRAIRARKQGVEWSALEPGAGIGYHEQKEDEVYYVLSGKGVMTLDDKPHDVGPGTAILTRPGSSHGLKQVGSEDLVILISYEIR